MLRYTCSISLNQQRTADHHLCLVLGVSEILFKINKLSGVTSLMMAFPLRQDCV